MDDKFKPGEDTEEKQRIQRRSSYFAHSVSGQATDTWQPLPEHLAQVASMAAAFADVFGAGALAQVQGCLHDLGKYTHKFQRKLQGDSIQVDHSTWGARIARERYGVTGLLLAYGMAGHHAGLANGQTEGARTPLMQRLNAKLEALDPLWEQEIGLPAKLSAPDGFSLLPPEQRSFQWAFLARMLFSCLVDADYLDTEAFYRRAEGQPSARERSTPSLQALCKRLDLYLNSLDSNRPVNVVRGQILAHVRKQAGQSSGLFSLTVPTGGGKTLASLAFALDHAIARGLRRVIFVIPFTSIVEQNAAVFRRALGNLGANAVLEHHSAFVETAPPAGDPERYQAQEKLRLAMENWDAPIVVTTAVQFFESLFAARPSSCRKLHNIAGSVVILDEAQTLPLHLLRPCVAAIDELARNYRSSIVLCTATQPALRDLPGGLQQPVRELAPVPDALFSQLERVRVRHVGELDDGALAAHMRSREQVLCIVNNRRHARAVFEAMADMPGARHLSTLMCARHRREVLAEVRQRLEDKLPCRLVSTSLIEAGVDVDFPTVLRAEAGLDSIAQAAGRCNREGRRDRDQSEVLIFTSSNPDWAPPPELIQFAQVARETLRHHGDAPLSPDAIAHYFQGLYWQRGPNTLGGPLMAQIQDSRIDSLPMESIAAQFQMIEDTQLPVIIAYDDAARRALKALSFAPGCAGLARDLQPYTVQVPRSAFNALRQAGAIQPVEPGKWGEQFMLLVNDDLYTPRSGLGWNDPAFVRAERLCW